MRVYDDGGKEVALDSCRIWRGEDAAYLILVLNWEDGLPPDIHTRLTARGNNDKAEAYYIVREIEHDMAKDQFTVQAIDEASFRRQSRFIPRPPRFSSVEEADAWLERHGG